MTLTVNQSSERVLYVNGNDLPVSLTTLYASVSIPFPSAMYRTYIVQCKATKDLDRLDLSNVGRAIYKSVFASSFVKQHSRFSDIEQINGVVVTRVPSEIVVKIGTLPSLGN